MVVGELGMETDVAVIGGGPGGYVAAIRAADLGLDVVLIEERSKLGGVCLLEGCIPSKTLINVVELANRLGEAKKMGLTCDGLKIDVDGLRAWTDKVVSTLTKGIDTLLEKRDVDVIRGHARFTDNRHLHIEGGAGASIEFKHAIIATGSSINKLPGDYDDLDLWTSREALTIPEVPDRLLVVGGGYIGLEMGLVYSGLGSKVTVVEFLPELLTGVDQDMVRVVLKHCEKKFDSIMTESKVVKVEEAGTAYTVTIAHDSKQEKLEFDRVLVAIGRHPNTSNLGLENTKIEVDEGGLIPTDDQGRTSEKHIFAIGDITHGPALAHKASREGRVAAEVIAGHPAAFDNRAIPAVVFTDPEIAWTGITEREAAEQKKTVNVGRFPLTALGRARTLGRTDGFIKIITEPETDLVLGVGIVAPCASELIAEGTLAIEMGATLEDLMVTIHPHPTLSESIMEAAEVAAGTPVHILPSKKS